MTTHHYQLTIDSLRFIPGDVLVEHLGYALRAFADKNGNAPHISLDDYAGSGVVKVDFREVRQHPFDGPELFDDDFINEDETRKDIYVDGGPYEGVKYVEVSNVTDKDRTFVPTQKDPVCDGFVPIDPIELHKQFASVAKKAPFDSGSVPVVLSEKDREFLSRTIAIDFPYLSTLFQHKREQQ